MSFFLSKIKIFDKKKINYNIFLHILFFIYLHMSPGAAIIGIISGFITDAITNATALATSDFGGVVGFFIGVWLVYKSISIVKGGHKAGL
jgi:hypothetical protein